MTWDEKNFDNANLISSPLLNVLYTKKVLHRSELNEKFNKWG